MDLLECLQIIRKRLWIVVATTLLCSVASAIISFYFLEEVYQANTVLYVGKSANADEDYILYNELLVGDKLVNDYRELVKSRLITSTVIEELGLEGMTIGALSSRLGVSQKNNTRLIEITAQDTDPKLAMDIANKVAEVFKEKVVELMDEENVQVIDEAILPQAPIKPNKKLNIAIGTFMGMMLGLGIIFLIEYLDNTVKTPEDVQKYVELTVIGTIPEFPEKISHK